MLRQIKLLFLTCFVICLNVQISGAQFNGNHWCFGDSAYIDWSDPQQPIVGNAAFNWRNGSSSIGDSNGLLMYAGVFDNGAPNNGYIWNKYHQPIFNAHHIYGEFWYHSSLFIPKSENDSIIYLFTIGVTVGDPIGFYYSTINYKANNDSGIVIQKNVQLNNFPAFDALMGVKHGNGRDWWVVFQRYTTSLTPFNSFYLYLVSPQGINGSFIQNIGSFRKSGGGQMIFNNDGSQFVQVSWAGMIELYNFDRCTGLITSTIPIEQEPATSPFLHTYTSCAYSKDDSKLYILDLDQNSNTYYLLQYDLQAANITASKIVIDSIVPPMASAMMKLAPDNKIYISSFDENFSWPYPDTSTAYTTINNNLSVINSPDSLGAACDFQPFSFNLGTGRSYYGLPNNPDYELGAWVGSPCDTLTVGINENSKKDDVFFQAWYNGEWNMIHVNAAKLKGNEALLRLFDVQGRMVYEKKFGVISGGYFTGEINMNVRRTADASGVYVVSLTTEKDKVQSKILKY